ncbi:MAG: phosphoadenosine phosphosulfate reductase family protein [Clostridia bacterium]
MKRILGRKQRTQNDRWIYAIEHIEALVSRQELDSAVATATAAIQRATEGKRSAYAWSGGKDSLVLSDICRQAGVTDCMFAHTDLEYPAFLQWCLEHKPDGCEVICTGQDLDWLASHQNMVFPSGAAQARWYQIVQRAAFTDYFFRHKLDVILVGHRKADGNVSGNGGVISKESGEVRFAPLADWPHELILAYIHYYGLELPPIYGWKDGFRCGTHPWPSRMHMSSVEQGYREVYEIDPSIVIDAAEKLSSARHFLEGVSA